MHRSFYLGIMTWSFLTASISIVEAANPQTSSPRANHEHQGHEHQSRTTSPTLLESSSAAFVKNKPARTPNFLPTSTSSASISEPSIWAQLSREWQGLFSSSCTDIDLQEMTRDEDSSMEAQRRGGGNHADALLWTLNP